MSNVKLVYDEKACWGCRACEVACKQEYNPFDYSAYDPKKPVSKKYVSVWGNGPRLVDGKLDFMFRVNVCKHCDDAPCIKSCPEGAITLDKDTGIVVHDKEKCNGCNSVEGRSGAEKQETSPCKFNCPAKNDVQAYVSLASKGKYREALELIKETSPFPSICGRVCHHPCESDCSRQQIDEALSIQSIERFVADKDYASGKPYVPSLKAAKKDKVAVIGSGPAGLSAAYFLAREGYKVTVFEKLPVAGGMMRVGIPEYRLPRDIIARDIKIIQDMGVEIKTGIEFGKDITIESLKKQGYKATFIATGLHKDRKLGVEKEDAKGIIQGVSFLRDVALGNPVSVGKKVIVVGGGNVAIDVALTSLRKGAKDVTMVCLEDRDEMPAWKHEIEEALEEGVKIVNCFGPNKFIEKTGKLSGVEFKRCTCVFDDCGTFNPKYDASDLNSLDADTVILAIGQAGDTSFAGSQGIFVNAMGRIDADPVTLMTSVAGVFAGGDIFHGPKSIVEAIGTGREAAISIDRYLCGESLTRGREKQYKMIKDPMRGIFETAARQRMPQLDPKERVKNFAEVRQGFTEEMAMKEASRCISCGTCCIQACPYDAITFNVATGKTQKCNLCIDRVKNGLIPACADNVCLAHCVYFGDAKNIESMVKDKFWLKARMDGKLGSLVIKVGDK